MEIPELENDAIIKDWLKLRKARPHTRKNYVFSMQAYVDWVKKTPTELIEEAEGEIEARVKPRMQKVKRYLIEFREHLENEEKAPLSIESRITAVRSFYKANDIVIPQLERQENTATVLEVHKGIPSKENIRKVLEIADPLEKAIILTGLSSGLSVNEICNLKISDFKKGYNESEKITTLSLRREKKNIDFVTFLTPEASTSIVEYLEYRGRAPRNGREDYAKVLRKQRIVNDDGYLFIKRIIDEEYLETKNEEIRKLTDSAVQEMYRTLCEKTGLYTDKGIFNMMRSHNMRKVFSNRLTFANCDPMLREFMMGHKIKNRTQASYFVNDSTELKKIYETFVPALTIAEKYDPMTDPNFKRLQNDNQALKNVIVSTAKESDGMKDELQELRAEIDLLKKRQKEEDKLISILQTYTDDQTIILSFKKKLESITESGLKNELKHN